MSNTCSKPARATNAAKASLDRPLHAAMARVTAGISPAALSQAYADRLEHFAFSPDKQRELMELAARQWARFRVSQKHHEDVVSFVTRQLLDVYSPVNSPLTNLDVLQSTFKRGDLNFLRGAVNFWEDWRRVMIGESPFGAEAFNIGQNVAATPRKIVLRNRLIELIQYGRSQTKSSLNRS